MFETKLIDDVNFKYQIDHQLSKLVTNLIFFIIYEQIHERADFLN